MNSGLSKIGQKKGKPKQSALIPTTNKFWADVGTPGPPLTPNPRRPGPKGLLPHPRPKGSGFLPPPQSFKNLKKKQQKLKKKCTIDKAQNNPKPTGSDLSLSNKDIFPVNICNQQIEDKQTINCEQTTVTATPILAGSSQGVYQHTMSTPVKEDIQEISSVDNANQLVSNYYSFAQSQVSTSQALYTVSKNDITFTVSQRNPASTYYIATQQYKQTHMPQYSYPKGIPKSFFFPSRQQTPNITQNQPPQTNQPMTNWPMQQQILVPTTPMYNDPGIHQPQMLVQTSNPSPIPPQAYSPSDVYVEDVYANYNEDNEGTQETHDELDSHNALAEGQKRLSAFQRLGPLTQPKKPKLTINLQLNKKESVREVVDLTDDSQTQEYVPVHLRQNIITSTDEIVMKYLILWPWKRTVGKRRSVTIRSSKSVMILEQEQMEEFYERDSQFIQVSITGYPSTWTKEMVLDTLLDRLKGLSFIPCFIEFTQEECKFLVIRSRVALVAIHKLCFTIRKDDVKLIITLSLINLTLKHIDFLPRLVLRKKLTMNYDGGDSLNFKAFTLQDDVSHFIYFPLSRSTNQSELIQLQSTITWQHIASLNLSYNKMTSIDSFNLSKVTPKLKHLDLSYNYLEKLTILLSIRDLPLHSIKVEGNPLCHDYIDPTHYVKVIRMMFPAIKEIDAIPIQLKGDLPAYKKIYCPEEVKPLVDKFLDVYFPLLEAQEEDKLAIKDLYEKNAMFTVIYKYKFIYRFFRKISHRNRFFDDGEKEVVEGASAIAKAVSSWPNMKYDPFSFSIDVVYHSEMTTVLRINGILKLTTESLADDEHIIAFAKTIALRTTDGAEYKISNELVLWDEPNVEHTKSAFQMTRVRAKQLNLKLEETPNDDLKAKLVEIFTQLTDLDSKASERCLDLKGWNIKAALEYFMQLLRLDDLGSLTN